MFCTILHAKIWGHLLWHHGKLYRDNFTLNMNLSWYDVSVDKLFF
jgi:hypothetical protein